jgi:hypothetical protein
MKTRDIESTHRFAESFGDRREMCSVVEVHRRFNDRPRRALGVF